MRLDHVDTSSNISTNEQYELRRFESVRVCMILVSPLDVGLSQQLQKRVIDLQRLPWKG